LLCALGLLVLFFVQRTLVLLRLAYAALNIAKIIVSGTVISQMVYTIVPTLGRVMASDANVETRRGRGYRVGSVLNALEMHHAVKTCVAGTATLVAMRIEFLLGEDVAAGLVEQYKSACRDSQVNCTRGREYLVSETRGVFPTSQEKDTMLFGMQHGLLRKSGQEAG
jgi:hypothetical protein